VKKETTFSTPSAKVVNVARTRATLGHDLLYEGRQISKFSL
jgi:hypothetical protein